MRKKYKKEESEKDAAEFNTVHSSPVSIVADFNISWIISIVLTVIKLLLISTG